MAQAKKCDICGRLYELYNCKTPANYPNYIELNSESATGSARGVIEYDTCPECMERIAKLIFEIQHNRMFVSSCRADFVKEKFNLPLEEDRR